MLVTLKGQKIKLIGGKGHQIGFISGINQHTVYHIKL